MLVNVQYLHGLVMGIVMIKPTPLNAIMKVEIAVALVLMISIVLNAHVIIATSQFQVNQLFILLLFCYNYAKSFFFNVNIHNESFISFNVSNWMLWTIYFLSDTLVWEGNELTLSSLKTRRLLHFLFKVRKFVSFIHVFILEVFKVNLFVWLLF